MVPTELRALAPENLPCPRMRRYDGGGFEVPLDQFLPDDRGRLRRLYDVARGLAGLGAEQATARDRPLLERYLRRAGEDGLFDDAGRLGHGAPRGGPVARALHDIRNGLTPVLGMTDLLAMGGDDAALVRGCLAAARGQVKMMRNLVPELDPPGRAADEVRRVHGVARFTARWAGSAVRGPSGPVAVDVHREFDGDVTGSCLESAAVDRVLCNYVDNAARFAADRRVEVWVFLAGPEVIRWAVRNRVSEDQSAFLAAAAPDPRRLFGGGVTRDGTGLGLANCAAVVAECFGLGTTDEAVGRGYLGAKAHGSEFLAWFHWPAYRDPEPG